MSDPSRATLIEVAARARTSKTSVSRFFGSERDRLSAPLQARIDQAARELGYQPNLIARGLKGAGSKLLGMVVADIRNPFSVAAVHAVERAARERGYALIVCNTDNDPEQERRHLELLAAYQVEGVIVNAAGDPHAQLHALRHRGVPVVLLDREIASLESEAVGLDDALAVDLALDHLEGQGYRALLFVTNAPQEASARKARLARFLERSAERGLSARTLTTLEANELACALKALPRAAPAAVLCANATATLSVTQAFNALHLPLGEIGLLGIDELDWCALVGPGISTLAQPFEAIAEAALARLLDACSTPARFAPRLIARGSTRRPGTPPALP
ncbi:MULTISPECIES: LacI family DNA-binding transcriptional regulator [unclassified Halomonas]|uniref:LacI family DNA-binding transcriptional regulator n=1 Tax=unclassified Halomonas TaxID=2609666 RepID=UPI00209DA4D1|nr:MULTISPECIES: substrate-binding domain-containing protein [unclassified Halomonas]MCP1315444.1 substrate-binding domain-containing protein [Halomonas sp. 707D7]MCP1326790.1 substrate-binding domain-containing protein [Halomonas sp. 707D4]